MNVLTAIDTYLYYPVLLVLLSLTAVWFTIRTRFVQIRLFPDAIRAVSEKPKGSGNVSSFQALMVSTASRVGTGNIVGVSTAICLGGPGAVFWMWVLAVLGAASAFVETTLAQIYKRKGKDGSCFGGPAYYIEGALHSKVFAVLFTVFLILTYGFGFQLLCSYNVQTTFQA
ncbi:MAG: alanine:cation symporter family protein, partial [Clostridia bacterium]|nr:alanine:cation symporter family protein [Clostridia bacterium]